MTDRLRKCTGEQEQGAAGAQRLKRRKRFALLLFTGFLGSLFGLGGEPAAAAAPGDTADLARPNILWIVAEDMGPDWGVYGEPESRTPTLDALAANGMRFTNAYATSPICSTSRSAFYTGMYSTSIGAHHHRTPADRKRPLPDGVRLLTDYFRDAGYFTVLAVTLAPPDAGTDGDAIVGSAKRDWNFRYDGRPYDSHDFNDLNDNQPFFAHVQFKEAHRGPAWDTAHERIDAPADPGKVDLPPYYPDHPIARRDWAQYLNAVMAFDVKVGYVLRRLEEQGLADNTIVVVFADHGRAMVRGKQWLYDSGLHIPLVVSWPKALPPPAGYRRGEVSERLVTAIDLTATTLSMAGIDPPRLMQGRPFFGKHGVTRRYAFGSRDRADETVDRIRTVRDKRFRYIRNYYPDRPYSQQNIYKETRYPVLRLMFRLHRAGELGPVPSLFMAPTRPAEELYDSAADPHQVHNLAHDPAYREKLVELRAALSAWEVETNDLGRIFEPPDVAIRIEQRSRERNRELMQAISQREGPWRADDGGP